jgi:thiamine-monophosphate kinase
MKSLLDLGEFGLIEHLHTRLQTRDKVLLGIGDDAAILSSLQTPVITCDGLVEHVHFRRDWTSPRDLGYKALAVNVSDVAAMGARPIAAFVTLALDKTTETPWVEELYAGMEEAAQEFNFTVAGGDTVKSLQHILLSITLVGEVSPIRQPLRRDGACSGDVLLVTGNLGDSAAGLALLQNEGAVLNEADTRYLLSRHHRPTPRLREIEAALNIAPEAITAALDLSDGLAGDAAHIARRSQVSLEIDVAALPISPACRRAAVVLQSNSHEWALRGGEDYELLLCIREEMADVVCGAVTEQTGTKVTPIGHCREKDSSSAPVVLVFPDGRKEAASGAWTHF